MKHTQNSNKQNLDKLIVGVIRETLREKKLVGKILTNQTSPLLNLTSITCRKFLMTINKCKLYKDRYKLSLHHNTISLYNILTLCTIHQMVVIIMA